MIWLVVLLITVLTILCLDNKTPKAAALSVARETLKGLRLLHMPCGHLESKVQVWMLKGLPPSPYKRIRDGVKHFPILLNLPTSEGSGEATHPDVLHVPEGWGAGGWTWLMAATPYPSGSDFFENPELFVSYDGICWTRPTQHTNPIVRVPAATGRRDLKKEYHSDASLLLLNGILNVYYRWSGVFLDRSVENRVNIISSANGLDWSGQTTLLSEKGAVSEKRGFLSPSLLFMDGKCVMWTVEKNGANREIVRRTSDDGLSWPESEKSVLEADYVVQAPWHLDVVSSAETGGTILLLTTAEDRGGQAELHYGFGDSEGLSWHLAGKLIDPGYFFEGGKIYRSSLVALGDGAYTLYYSAFDGTKWSIARLDLQLDADRRIFEYEHCTFKVSSHKFMKNHSA
jgi:hypothetical protein